MIPEWDILVSTPSHAHWLQSVRHFGWVRLITRWARNPGWQRHGLLRVKSGRDGKRFLGTFLSFFFNFREKTNHETQSHENTQVKIFGGVSSRKGSASYLVCPRPESWRRRRKCTLCRQGTLSWVFVEKGSRFLFCVALFEFETVFFLSCAHVQKRFCMCFSSDLRLVNES